MIKLMNDSSLFIPIMQIMIFLDDGTFCELLCLRDLTKCLYEI